MRTRWFSGLALAGLVIGLAGWPTAAEEPKDKAKEEAALVKSAEAFIEAFAKSDARALAGFWTPDGDYTDLTGRNLKGREAIEKAFQEFFAQNKGAKLRIDSHSLRFVTPEVALEDGVTEVISPDGLPPTRARYTIVHVKKDGQWLLSSVRDAPYTPPSNYEHLRPLAWAVGSWAGEGSRGDAEHLTFSWADHQNFLIASFNASVKGVTVGSATHWIAWDPTAKRIRSWVFDASGGFGEGAWTRDGDKWTIKMTSVQQDGKKAAQTVVLGRVDANTLTLQAKDRSVDGKPVPDTPEFKLKRVN
jgi:uncharacterized protein (TIGR02246 family)